MWRFQLGRRNIEEKEKGKEERVHVKSFLRHLAFRD